MDKTTALILAIVIIVVLLAVAIVTFVLYKKTPAPKGCENLEPGEGICCACLKSACPYYAQYHDPKPADDKADSASAKPAAPAAPTAPAAPKAPAESVEKKEEKK
jgi:flagellar basal body-associated protein FliL